MTNFGGKRNLKMWRLVLYGALLFATSCCLGQDPENPRPKLCKEEDHVYFPHQHNCHKIGSHGPCFGRLSIVQRKSSDDNHGECACKGKNVFPEVRKPRVFAKDIGHCFHYFDQGPCDEGYWLVPSTENWAFCEPIPCYDLYVKQKLKAHYHENDEEPETFLFPHHGECFEMFKEGFPKCDDDEKVYWRFDKEGNFKTRCKPE